MFCSEKKMFIKVTSNILKPRQRSISYIPFLMYLLRNQETPQDHILLKSAKTQYQSTSGKRKNKNEIKQIYT